jgi:hypothetical protein
MRQQPDTTIKQLVAGVVLVVCLTGCGGGGDSNESTKPDRRSAAKSTMTETCSGVETGMRKVGGDWFPVPTEAEAEEFLVVLDELTDAGDAESRDGLMLLSDPIDQLVAGYPEPGQELINASKRMDGGIGAFADRCRAAGMPIQVRGGSTS